MPVTMSDDDFEFIYEYLHRSHMAVDNSDVVRIVRMGKQAWQRAHRIALEIGRDLPDTNAELTAILEERLKETHTPDPSA